MIELLAEVGEWIADPGRWTGSDGIPARTLEHLWLAVLSTGIAALVVVPLAVWLAHRRRAEFIANWLANLGRAIPSFGIIILAALLFIEAGVSLRFWPIVVALFALAVPPMFTNSYTAIRTVPEAAVESARGMGMTEREVALRVEVPVGAALIMTGIRIAFIQVIATVPLGAIISSGGGLGQYIVRGFASGVRGHAEVLAGALLVITLTLLAAGALTLLTRVSLAPGVRRLVDTSDLTKRGQPG